VNIALLFFLLTNGCGAPASWAARDTTACLDNNCASHYLDNAFRWWDKLHDYIQLLKFYFTFQTVHGSNS